MSACSSRIKACETCATAKIRCTRKADSAICDRCLRLNKSCHIRPARRRPGCQPKETRLESLERKVAQLLGQNQEKDDIQDGRKKGDIVDRGVITLDEAAVLLESFRHSMLPHFPFVALSPDITVGELRDHKPFLFLAILSVSVTDNQTLQRDLDDEMKSALADRTILGPVEPSLETLQGLLVVLAWSQHQTQHHPPRRNGPPVFFTYLHIAIGLVVELELDRPVGLRKRCPRLTVQAITTPAQPADVLRAQQRAAIGCFLLSSWSSLITQTTCTFPWSCHLEKFATELAQSPEVPSDQSLIPLVRLQHLAEQIDSISTDPNPLGTNRVASGDNGVSFLHTFQAFQTQLQDYATLLGPQWTHNNFLLASQLYTATLYLCQVSLFEKQVASQLSSSFRADILCQGLIAAKNWFDALLAHPPGTERRFIYTQWLHCGFNLILSCKLALLAVSDEALRNQPRVQSLCGALNMSRVLQVCIESRLTQVQPLGPKITGFNYAGWLKWLQDWFQRQESLYTGSPGKASAVPPASHPMVPQQFNLTDLSDVGLDVTGTDAISSWPCYADIYASSNIFSGWMDLSALSKYREP